MLTMFAMQKKENKNNNNQCFLFYRGTKSKRPKYVIGLYEYFWYIFCVYFNREWEHPTENMDMVVIQIMYYVL